jgi:hypothetical protein
MNKIKRTLRAVKKYSGMVSMAATAGIIITTVIMKLKNKE